MNNKGFTLTELIVTMAILGIIMTMAFPAITKLQTENQQQVYETYEKVLLNGAKLYVDKYGRDLWPNTAGSNCVSITYDDLMYEDLIKDFNGKKGESVNSGGSYVNATKGNNNSITYEVSLKIVNAGGGFSHNMKRSNPCVHVNLRS